MKLHAQNLPVYLVRGVAVSILVLVVVMGVLAGLGAFKGACTGPDACLDYSKTQSNLLIDRVLGTPEHPDFLTVAFHRWGNAIGGLGGQLLTKALGFGVLVSFLLALGLAATRLTRRPHAARPTQMSFGGDPRGLRGTVKNAHQQPDGSWTATTTDRQREWLTYQARRAGLPPKKEK